MARDRYWRGGAPGRNLGVALITAVMIMAMMATFAVYLIEDNHISIRRVANQRDIEVAHQLAVGGEELAVFTIEADGLQDVSRSNNWDYYGEFWSQTLEDGIGTKERTLKSKPDALLTNEPVGDGLLSVVMFDAGSRFNLNNLAVKVPPPTAGNNAVPVSPTGFYTAFKQLLTNIGIDDNFADAVSDWLDNNTTPDRLNGAEDEYYTGLDGPYRAANTVFTDVSELRLVRGFDEIKEDKQKKLLSLVSALPVGYGAQLTKSVPINLHTAPIEILMLLPLKDRVPMTQAQASQIAEFREDNGPFKDVEEFVAKTGGGLGITYELTPVNPANNTGSAPDDEVIKRLFGVNSQFFEVESTVSYGRFDYKLNSLIRRYPGASTPKPSAGIIRRTRHLTKPKKAT